MRNKEQDHVVLWQPDPSTSKVRQQLVDKSVTHFKAFVLTESRVRKTRATDRLIADASSGQVGLTCAIEANNSNRCEMALSKLGAAANLSIDNAAAILNLEAVDSLSREGEEREAYINRKLSAYRTGHEIANLKRQALGLTCKGSRHLASPSTSTTIGTRVRTRFELPLDHSSRTANICWSRL